MSLTAGVGTIADIRRVPDDLVQFWCVYCIFVYVFASDRDILFPVANIVVGCHQT